MQPIPDTQIAWSFFFMAFIVVGAFFVLNLFTGIVIDNFNNMKRKLGKDHVFLTDEQREWVELQEALLAMKVQRPLKRPKHRFRRRCFNLIRSTFFDWFIMICIIINTVFMAAKSFGEPHEFTRAVEILNYIFATVFTIEMVLKLLGLGFKQYFGDGWNIFDFLVTIGSDIGIILQLTMGNANLSALLVVRTFRIGRVFRLVQSAKALRTLFNTLVLTLPSMANVTGILILMFFIFAVMGVQLFATVKNGEVLNYAIHFRSFGRSFLTLFRCATGEIWDLLMYDCLTSEECDPHLTYNPAMCGFNDSPDCIPLNGCGTWMAYIFFFGFTTVVTFVLLQLFIGVILDGFGNTSSAENAKLTPEQYDQFVTAWNRIYLYNYYCIYYYYFYRNRC